MKKFIALAAIGFLIVGCSQEEFVGESQNSSSNGEITFSMSTPNATRGGTPVDGATAAEKLNGNFVVYGFKNGKGKAEDVNTSSTVNDSVVFKRYNVNYVAASANTTKSNTSNWEYVGLTSLESKAQTIKYWDYGAERYVFSAISGTGVTPVKTLTGTTVYDKGWTVTVPAGGSIADLYASDRKVVTKASGNYKNEVELTFYSMITKIRFALYETVPGYSVKIDRFYYNDLGTETSTNFAIDGKFKTLKSDADTKLTVTYYDNSNTAVENHPKVTYTDSEVNTETYKLFGTNMQAQEAIGTTSNTATYDQDGNLYTCILPYQSQSLDTPEDNILKLKVDYTLKSTDDSGEEIHVTGATASVPTQYTQWKNNFAYTYLFKISDNTNGTTGDPSDPSGLYPITFDALVVAAEDGIQETVTSVTEPSITTYAKGVNATANATYEASDVYYTINKDNALVSDISSARVFEVNNYAEGEITESLVAEYLTNKVVLTPVEITEKTDVHLSDGTDLKFATKQCYKFAAKAGKVYAIKYEYETGKNVYKIVRVSGTDAAAPNYSLACDAKEFTSTTDGSVITLTNTNGTDSNQGVLGAKNFFTVFNASDEDVTDNFTITETGDGKYTVKLTDDAIKAGANGTYTVKFNGTIEADKNFTVNFAYTFWTIVNNAFKTQIATSPVAVVVAAGNSATFGFAIGTAVKTLNKISDAVISSESGIEIKSLGNGIYQVNVDANVTGGDHTVTIGGQSLTITVNSYAFSGNLTFVYGYSTLHAKTLTADAQKLYLTLNNAAITTSVAPNKLTGYDSNAKNIAAIAEDSSNPGVYTVTPSAKTTNGGSYTVTYENASSKITVTKYTLAAASASIAKSTGSTTLTLTKYDGETTTIIPSASAVKVYKYDTSAKAWIDQTSGFSLIASGKALVFGNVAAEGKYRLEYTVKVDNNDKVVAYQEINVTTSSPAKANLGSMGKGSATW